MSTSAPSGGPVESIDGATGASSPPSSVCGSRCGGCSVASASCASNSAESGPARWRYRLSSRLGVIPPAVLAPLVMGCVAVGLFIAGAAGAVLLIGALGLLGVLTALAWPSLSLFDRALRVSVFVLIVGLAVIRLAPH